MIYDGEERIVSGTTPCADQELDPLVGVPLRHGEAPLRGVRLHYVEAGEGPLVVLLHGFPEFWLSWRYQIPALVAAGFRVVALDLRGYNLSQRPRGIANYRPSLLAQDVADLVHHLGAERAHLVGHDWGGIVAWQVALNHPTRVARLIPVNAPHPRVFIRGLRRPSQVLRSSYALFFQLPWLPETLIRAGDFALMERVFRHDPLRPGAYSDEEIAAIKQALGRPGALMAALNYYRAALRSGRETSEGTRRIELPTLLIWGDQDRYLGPHLADGHERWASPFRLERIPGASHWVHHDMPARVNDLIVRFLSEA